MYRRKHIRKYVSENGEIINEYFKTTKNVVRQFKKY